jgi:ribosome recycling factor
MLAGLKKDTEQRMGKTLEALASHFSRIRTGRAHPSLLDGVYVTYYGSEMPLGQVANINVEDARTLTVTPWERNMIGEIEKAILKSDLGVNPVTAGTVMRIPMPPLTEETRKNFIKQARHEAEQAKVSVRNVRRDALAKVKDMVKEKEISEDEERKAQEEIQRITDRYIADIDKALSVKEEDLMAI